MKKACASQCAECPFRTTSVRGWLGGYEEPGVVFSSLWHKEPFFCHVRTDYKREEWLQHVLKEGQLCLGALIFMGKQRYFPRPDDAEIEAAMADAMSRYHEHPEQFDVMEPGQFMEHHQPFKESK